MVFYSKQVINIKDTLDGAFSANHWDILMPHPGYEGPDFI